ncbi:MAG TPA: hypothetical protein H9963_05390, partial [Candidatus Flavonifractor avicola]|nr:hypothetical protein [Candidatus Flavonifractor avicola]
MADHTGSYAAHGHHACQNSCHHLDADGSEDSAGGGTYRCAACNSSCGSCRGGGRGGLSSGTAYCGTGCSGRACGCRRTAGENRFNRGRRCDRVRLGFGGAAE